MWSEEIKLHAKGGNVPLGNMNLKKYDMSATMITATQSLN
jgi:hypothetical protein